MTSSLVYTADVLITEHQGTLEMRYRTSYGRKIVMLCRKVRQSWFFAEAQALWKLALPIVSCFVSAMLCGWRIHVLDSVCLSLVASSFQLLMWFFQQLLLFCVVLLVGHFSDKTTFGAVCKLCILIFHCNCSLHITLKKYFLYPFLSMPPLCP